MVESVLKEKFPDSFPGLNPDEEADAEKREDASFPPFTPNGKKKLSYAESEYGVTPDEIHEKSGQIEAEARGEIDTGRARRIYGEESE